MNDILPLREENVSGLLKVQAAYTSALTAMNRPFQQNIATAPSFIAGERFYDIAHSQQSAGYSCVSEKTAAGTLWKTQVVLFVPKLSVITSALVHEMRNQKFIVIANDTNGFRRIIGTKQTGLNFSCEENTQTIFGARGGYSFTFYATLADEPPFYTA
jgi:hypothetical protein